jgi:hypothetical protein
MLHVSHGQGADRVSIERRGYAVRENSWWLSNGDVELVVPEDMGGRHMFHNFPHVPGRSGEATWQNRGGHRLWAAPEHAGISQALDNGPVGVVADGLRLHWTVRFAPWALSVMRPDGTAVAGFPPRCRHDERPLPANPLVMSRYTHFSTLGTLSMVEPGAALERTEEWCLHRIPDPAAREDEQLAGVFESVLAN